MDKRLESMFISQCNICSIAPAMRHCNECRFKAGLEYWMCKCDNEYLNTKVNCFV